MEIRYVREFLSLAETGSYFETAEQLFVTTSSLSRHIKTLESEMGVTLFDRTTRKVCLNRYGKLFLPYAKDLVRIDDECTQAFATDRHEQISRLAIGSIPMMRAYRITDLLAEYQHGNKTAELNVTEGDPFNLLPKLRDKEIDFAFLRDQGDISDEFETISFMEDHLCIVVPVDHRLAQKHMIAIGDLENEPLLMIGKDAYMYKLCTDLCRNAGFEPNVRFTSHRAENLIDAVMRGLGLAMLMRRPAEMLITDTCRLIDVVPEVKTVISLVWLKNRKLPLHHQKFVELVRGIEC